MQPPYGTCPECGWQGRDWGFKYHSACKQCLRQWDGENDKKQGSNKTSGSIVGIADGISITAHVQKRLQNRAEREVGFRGAEILFPGGAIGALIGGIRLYCGFLDGSEEGVFLSAVLLIGGMIACVIGCMLGSTRARLVNKRVVELATAREDIYEERRLFYGSSEWRLLRQQIIADQGRCCQLCGQYIRDDFDLTVDHIKPRSKFPELALEKSNLQVLCRQCNSRKGSALPDSLEQVLENRMG